MSKIAFCFLLYDKIIHNNAWLTFFFNKNQSNKSYNIYSHLKTVTKDTQQWIYDKSIPTIETEWCGENLVQAWVNMIIEGLKDPQNKYFILLSGECIPLYEFQETYDKITSTYKSRININFNKTSFKKSGLYYADQWVLLNRINAIELVKLMNTKEGHNFIINIKKRIVDHCPDELYPVNWFVYKYGNPNSVNFLKYFDIIPTTYTFWEGTKDFHPIKYNLDRMRQDYNKICGSKALFARKFEPDAAMELSGSCPSLSSSFRSSTNIASLKSPKPSRLLSTKIAFCFLVYDRVIHNSSWLKFFNEDKGFPKSYTIYSHIKEVNNNTQQWLIDHSIPSIQTGWCEESLILAWILMLREALKDPNNEYFILLSGECIPLFGFQETYNKITGSNKARININTNAKPAVATGLLWADQWVLLTRPTAIELIKLMTTKQGHDFITKIRKLKGSYCSDELYPVNWFAYKYGNPNSIKFRKYFDILPTTYTYWDGKSPHPVKYDVESMRRDYNKICGSKALFARKFEPDAGAELSGTCPYSR